MKITIECSETELSHIVGSVQCRTIENSSTASQPSENALNDSKIKQRVVNALMEQIDELHQWTKIGYGGCIEGYSNALCSLANAVSKWI